MSKYHEATVELIDGMAFRATGPGGHTLVLDAVPEAGGKELGPRPIHLLLFALGGCTGMDVISILRKMRQDVTGYQVRLHGDRAEDHPMIYTHITVEHVVRGRGVNPDSVKRAVELSVTRYCSVLPMLNKAATVEESYRVIDEETGAEVTGLVSEALV